MALQPETISQMPTFRSVTLPVLRDWTGLRSRPFVANAPRSTPIDICVYIDSAPRLMREIETDIRLLLYHYRSGKLPLREVARWGGGLLQRAWLKNCCRVAAESMQAGILLLMKIYLAQQLIVMRHDGNNSRSPASLVSVTSDASNPRRPTWFFVKVSWAFSTSQQNTSNWMGPESR